MSRPHLTPSDNKLGRGVFRFMYLQYLYFPKNNNTHRDGGCCHIRLSYTDNLKLVEVEALGAIEITLDAALRSLNELLAVDDDVGNLLV